MGLRCSSATESCWWATESWWWATESCWNSTRPIIIGRQLAAGNMKVTSADKWSTLALGNSHHNRWEKWSCQKYELIHNSSIIAGVQCLFHHAVHTSNVYILLKYCMQRFFHIILYLSRYALREWSPISHCKLFNRKDRWRKFKEDFFGQTLNKG